MSKQISLIPKNPSQLLSEEILESIVKLDEKYRKNVISVIQQNFSDNEEMDTKIHLCRRCGRRIKDIQSIELGMGPTCYLKYLREKCQNKTHHLF